MPPAEMVTVALRMAPSLAAAVAVMAASPMPEVWSKVSQVWSATISQERSVLMLKVWSPPALSKGSERAVRLKEPFWLMLKLSSSSPAFTVMVALRSSTSLGSATATMVRVRPSGSGVPFSRLKLIQLWSQRTSQSWLVWMVKFRGPPAAEKSLDGGVTYSLPARPCLMVITLVLAIFSPRRVRVALRSSNEVLDLAITTTSVIREDDALEAGVTSSQSAPLDRVRVQGVLALTLKVMASGSWDARVYTSTALHSMRMDAAAFSGVICVSILYIWQEASAPSTARGAKILVNVFISVLFLFRG